MMQKIPVGSLIFFADPDMNMEGWNKPGTLATRNSMKFFATHGHVGIYTGNGLMYHISDGS